MLDRYIALIERNTVSIEDIKVGSEILFHKKEIKRLYSKDLKSYPINKRKNEIKLERREEGLFLLLIYMLCDKMIQHYF